MNLYFIVDIVLICIALGIVARSWRRGFVSSLVRLVGAIASYAGAWILSRPLSTILYNNFVRGWLVNYSEGLVPPDLQKMADSFAAMGGNNDMLAGLGFGDIGAVISDKLAEVMSSMGLDSLPFSIVDTDVAGSEIATGVLDKGMSIAEALTDVLLQPLAMMVLRVACFAVIFGVLSIVVSIVYRIGFGFNHIPLVGGLNHLLGAGVGLVEAAIIVYIICTTLLVLSTILGSRFEFLSWHNLEQAKLLSYVVSINPIAGLGIL